MCGCPGPKHSHDDEGLRGIGDMRLLTFHVGPPPWSLGTAKDSRLFTPVFRAKQANPEKAERKGIGIPSVLEKVKAAAPQKMDFGIDYYRKFLAACYAC